MLVLTRKPTESFELTMADGTTVVVRVAGVEGDHVRVGIEAPRSVKIMRTEIKDDPTRNKPREKYITPKTRELADKYPKRTSARRTIGMPKLPKREVDVDEEYENRGNR